MIETILFIIFFVIFLFNTWVIGNIHKVTDANMEMLNNHNELFTLEHKNNTIQNEEITILREKVEKLGKKFKNLQDNFIQMVNTAEANITREEFYDALNQIEEKFASQNQENFQILNSVQDDARMLQDEIKVAQDEIKKIDKFQKTQHRRLKNFETFSEDYHHKNKGFSFSDSEKIFTEENSNK